MNNFVIAIISISILLLVIVFISLYYVMHIESGKECISNGKNSSGLLKNLLNTLKVLLLGLLIFFIDFDGHKNILEKKGELRATLAPVDTLYKSNSFDQQHSHGVDI